MLARRRDVAADLTEALGALLGAKTPRDLLVQLHHADVALCLVVVKRHSTIVHKGQHFPLVGLHAVQQVLVWTLFDTPALFWVARRRQQAADWRAALPQSPGRSGW